MKENNYRRTKGFFLGSVCIATIALLWMVYFISAFAAENVEKRKVKVAFFPMEGYHVINADGSYGGIEVEYLRVLSEYVNWDVEYVPCDSWEDALDKLQKKQVDLVGTSQYSVSRAQVFLYADMPNGYTFGAIATEPDMSIAYEDFNKMKDLRYGIVKGYVRSLEFFEYMAENGIQNPKVTEYSSTEEMQEALHKGEIDAIVHTLMEVEDGQRLIGRFASKPTYFMTYRGNTQLIKELNEGIADVKYKHPSLEAELMYKFYESRWDDTVLFTTEELRFLQSVDEIVVGYPAGHYPFNYEENGEFKGIVKELLDSKNMKFIYKEMPDRATGVEALKNGTVDVLLHMVETSDLLADDSIQVLHDYASIPYVLIMPENKRLEAVQTIITMKDFKESIPTLLVTDNKTILYADTIKECFDAVVTGQADALVGGAYLSEYMIKMEPDYALLSIRSVLNDEMHIRLAVSKDADECLKSIMSKSMQHIDEKIITEYTLKQGTQSAISLKVLIRNNSSVIILLLSLVIILVVAVAGHIIEDNKKIQKLLYKDANMDIWNQHYFLKKVDEKRKFESKKKYAVVYTNILRMRQYNLVYGRNAAIKVYQCIKNTLFGKIDYPTEICARINNDHFLLLLRYENMEDLLFRLNQMQSSVSESICELTDNHLQLQLGVCPEIHNHREAQTLIESAIQVVDADDDKNGNHIHIYDSDFERQMKERHKKEKMLESISIDDHFLVYYQNKVDIRTDQIVGAEALIRFKDPEDGGAIKSPWFFIPYFEQIGRVVEIDFFVLKSVCRMMQKRMCEGKKVVPVSCNFSRLNFVNSGFSDKFEAVLNKYGIPKDLIEVEITETMVIEQEQRTTIDDNLREMKERNIRLAIDDFGSGYSSLGIFEHIPAAVIKLDRSFMQNHENGERQMKIMKGIVRLSEELDAEIVCEGVETLQDISLMHEINAHVAQGYFYSKPAPEEIFESMLESESN